MKQDIYGNFQIQKGDLVWAPSLASPPFYDKNTKTTPVLGGVGVADAVRHADPGAERLACGGGIPLFGEDLPLLHGLPAGIKDLEETKDLLTTYGSPLYRDYIPAENDLIIDRLQAAGIISLGKTNTPEWALGSNTFNPVFGATGNAYNPAHTAGGSSGGAAVALAQRHGAQIAALHVKPMLGTNPIAVAAPTDEPFPFMFDAATTWR